LAKALFPVFTQRVALLCCGNCYLVVTKGTWRTLGVLTSSAADELLQSEIRGLLIT
jgi:hypothetical protein